MASFILARSPTSSAKWGNRGCHAKLYFLSIPTLICNPSTYCSIAHQCYWGTPHIMRIRCPRSTRAWIRVPLDGLSHALTDDGLFIGQSPAFFALLHDLAAQADAAQRGV